MLVTAQRNHQQAIEGIGEPGVLTPRPSCVGLLPVTANFTHPHSSLCLWGPLGPRVLETNTKNAWLIRKPFEETHRMHEVVWHLAATLTTPRGEGTIGGREDDVEGRLGVAQPGSEAGAP